MTLTGGNNNIKIKFDNIKNKHFKKHIFKNIIYTGEKKTIYIL